MIRDHEKEKLSRGEPLIGSFNVAGGADSAAGILRWSPERGALLELLDAEPGWEPASAGEHFTVHGSLRDGGEVSMVSSWVKKHALNTYPLDVISPGIALGQLTSPDERWPEAFYSTHNFDQWRRQTGMEFSRPNRRARPKHFRLDVQPPPVDRTRVRGAELTFGTHAEAPIVLDSPSWTVDTHQVLRVDPDRPFTMKRAARYYGGPLIALTAFAMSRPDAFTREAYANPAERRHIELWWSGRQWGLEPWRPGTDRALFRAEDLDDYALSIRRWWRLHQKVWPALEIFVDHVRGGRTYSPYRFLTLYTAVEAYTRERIGQNNLRKLRDYGGMPERLTGCSNRALALIGVSREYFAHIGTSKEFSIEQIEDGVYDSTRRLQALLQAALLRDFGFRKRRALGLLENHYGNWPIPSL